MNSIFLHGFTGKDPEVKTINSGKKVAKFSLATSKNYKDHKGNKMTHTDWHNIVAWEKLAELCEKYVKKGSELIVTGEVTYREYTDPQGVKKYFTEIICNSIEFCGKKETDSRTDNNEGKPVKGTDIESQIRNGDFNDDESPF